MTTTHDDKILENTSNWRNINSIVRKVGGDKTTIVAAIHRLEEIDYLQVSKDKNKILYKRKDTIQSEFDFLKMMETLEANQKTELNVIKQIPTIMMEDGKRFRKKGLDLLEHIQEEVDRSYMAIIRIDNQVKSSIMPNAVANERKKMLDKYIEKIMSIILNKYKEKNTRIAIQEYFQNHTKAYEYRNTALTVTL